MGTRNFFLSPQSQFRNMKKHFRNRNSATFKEMLLRNCNSAIPQSQFFPKSATWELHFRNFRHILGHGVAWNLIFFTTRCFSLLRGFKETVAQDFQPLFLPWINPIWTPESYSKRSLNSVSNSNTPNLGYESEIHMGSIHTKNRRPIISCYCPFNASFCFHWDSLL